MKEPQAVAKELIEKFYEDKGFFNKLSWEQSKQFALICVGQITEEMNEYTSVRDRINYWQSVKKHIEQA